MCGISGIFGEHVDASQLHAMIAAQTHRGPEACGAYLAPSGRAALGHNRLKIIDLTDAARQPMSTADGRLTIVFNGEIYNYRELKRELPDYPYISQSDTEVALAAFARWGAACLDRFIGMFAFLIWDERERRLFAARDRFGVKPLNYHAASDGTLRIASEIGALTAAGVDARPDVTAWATYLASGLHDHAGRTFWDGIRPLPAGHCLTWHEQTTRVWEWYDLEARVGSGQDARPLETVEEEYSALLAESVALRFRSDVPVGINLSGGLDSSMLLGLTQKVQGADSDVAAFTFVTGDPRYDELPWVRQMVGHTRHPLVRCELRAADVPAIAASVSTHQHEPFGGIPTLAYARLFDAARDRGVIVLLDGQGMDEQWAGYDYYTADAGRAGGIAIQGSRHRALRPECLEPEFRRHAESPAAPVDAPDRLRKRQLRDIRSTKLPRALRFNDRISMRASTELREPFLDHRLVELALRQPDDRKIRDGVRKWLPRRIARTLIPPEVGEAPKRPVQTPQREWLRAPLRDWASSHIDAALGGWSEGWLNRAATRAAWREYCEQDSDNSFYVWQWVNLGLLTRPVRARTETAPPAPQPTKGAAYV